MLGLVGFLLVAWALVEGAEALRIRRWRAEQAYVDHCHQAHPFGRPADSIELRVVVVGPDGSERSERLQSGFERNVHYFHQLVYFADGIAREAKVDGSRPLSGDRVALYVDPEDPNRYRARAPHLGAYAALATIGASLIWAWLAV